MNDIGACNQKSYSLQVHIYIFDERFEGISRLGSTVSVCWYGCVHHNSYLQCGINVMTDSDENATGSSLLLEKHEGARYKKYSLT